MQGDIRLNDKGDGLICETCRLLYEIKDDIPIMLIDEAKPLKLVSGQWPVARKCQKLTTDN